MNVLIYTMSTPKPNGGGVSRMTYYISEGLKSRGNNVCYLCFEKLETDTPLQGVFYFPELKKPKSSKNKGYLASFFKEHDIGFVINQIPLNEEFCDMLYELKPQGVRIASVIHNSSLNLVRQFAYSKEFGLRQSGRSWVFHILKSWPIKQIIIAAYIRKHRQHYLKMDHGNDYIIAVSNRNIDDIHTLIGYKSLKVISINNFINTNNEPIPSKEKLVIWCGRLETNNKCVDMMIDIWARVCKQHPDWRLAIMGLDEVKGMPEYAQSLGAENIDFTGLVKTEDYYKRASIICHTSLSESFGLVLVEAMNWGCVPMAFDSFPACQDLIPSDCGYRIKAFDKEEYAKSLSDLMDNHVERETRALRCKKISSTYNEDNSIKEWIKLIEQKILKQ